MTGFKGRAEKNAAQQFVDRQLRGGVLVDSHAREVCGIPVTGFGLGTYLGNMDVATDARVTSLCTQFVEAGGNVFDTAINYRAQRAERSVGDGLRRLFLAGKVKREELFISSKAGFIPFEFEPTHDLKSLFHTQYVQSGIARESDLVAGCHCLAPKYLANQLERSLKNLNLETIDLYYIHNPETQLEELPARVVYEKLGEAFVFLEQAVAAGKIANYGLATWNAFRGTPIDVTGRQSRAVVTSGYSELQLEQCMLLAEQAAESVGHKTTSFRAVQMPLNLAMPDVAIAKTQKIGGQSMTALAAAKMLGLSVSTSVPLFQGRLCHGLPDFLLEKFPEQWSQAHCALSFVSTFDDVDCVLIGMKSPEHLTHNLSYLREEGLTHEQLKSIILALHQQLASPYLTLLAAAYVPILVRGKSLRSFPSAPKRVLYVLGKVCLLIPRQCVCGF